MTDSIVKRIQLVFPEGQVPFRTTATINIPFRPREIRFVDSMSFVVDVSSDDNDIEGYFFSDLFTKGSSGDGFISHSFFGATGFSAPSASWSKSRITFPDHDRPNINGSYTFEFRSLDGNVYVGDKVTSELSTSLVLEFIR